MIIDTATRTCNGKRIYPDHATARAVLKKAKRRRRPGPQDPIRAYRCVRCEGWHMSSTKEGKR